MSALVLAAVALLALTGSQVTVEASALPPCSCLKPGKSCNGCPAEFDSYVLDQSWQPEFCHGHGAQYPGCSHHAAGAYMVNHLTLHGLWPQYSKARNGSTYPFNCSRTKFDPAALDKVRGGRAALIEYWPNVKASTSDWHAYQGFWEHEWGKHGTCTGLSQRDYFTAALEKLQKFGTPAVITDNVGKAAVPKTQIQASYGGGKRVSLSCGGGSYLSAVATCWALDKPSHLPAEQIDCPPAVLQEDTCHSTSIVISGFGQPSPPPPPGPSPPPPPGPSPPPAGQCVANKHGPPCKSNADCLHVPHCLRCAKSGFCTLDPKSNASIATRGVNRVL